MKAAVLHEVGGIPRYEEFPAPVAGEGEVIVGRLAVKVARLLGAGRIVATGRDAEALRDVRASGVEICGAARGLDPAVMADTYGQLVRWARDGALTFDREEVPLSEIEAAWRRPGPRGSRLVVVP